MKKCDPLDSITIEQIANAIKAMPSGIVSNDVRLTWGERMRRQLTAPRRDTRKSKSAETALKLSNACAKQNPAKVELLCVENINPGTVIAVSEGRKLGQIVNIQSESEGSCKK